MNRKEGFVLIETIIVIVVVVVCMLGLYKSYSFVFNNLKQNMNYEKINDIYILNAIYKTLRELPQDNYVKITPETCLSYMTEDCEPLFSSLEIDNLIYISIGAEDLMKDIQADGLSNTDINYISTLQRGYKYLILHYNKNEKDYYASLALEEAL